MRRSLHCMIVALLCATLFVDSARACWFLRHRCRESHCQPTACPPSRATACHSWSTWTDDACPAAWVSAPASWHGHDGLVVVENGIWSDGVVVTHRLPASDGCEPCDGAVGSVVADAVVIENSPTSDDGAMPHEIVATDDRGAGPTTEKTEGVVVHDPTIVVGGTPADAAPPARDTLPEPKTARAAAPQPQLAAREPLPDLKPAVAAGEQPVPASLDLPAEPSKAAVADEKAMAEKPSQPAAPDVGDLATRQGTSAPAVEPKEVNLFDELDDETWDANAPSEPAAGNGDAEPSEPEMKQESAEEPSDDADPSASDGDEPAPAAEPESTATIVPDEPMRRWTDATGDHHAQGWLAEVRDAEVRILKVNGRYTTMAVADLSDADQAYVTEVTSRLAAQRQPSTTVNDTAGL